MSDPNGVPPSATIDIATNTIVITEPYDSQAGQVKNTYEYTLVPPVPIFSEWGIRAFGLMLLIALIVVIRRPVAMFH